VARQRRSAARRVATARRLWQGAQLEEGSSGSRECGPSAGGGWTRQRQQQGPPERQFLFLASSYSRLFVEGLMPTVHAMASKHLIGFRLSEHFFLSFSG
jgi:hypothetical protein